MPCNCKKINQINETYGEPVEENYLSKFIRYCWKAIFFILTIILGIIITPIIVVVAIYKIIFKNSSLIILPKFLSKHIQ